MVNNIPEDLLEEFKRKHEDAKILDFKIKESEHLKIEGIYYEYFNVLGLIEKTTYLNTNFSRIDDNSLIVGDIEVFLEKSRWFNKNK